MNTRRPAVLLCLFAATATPVFAAEADTATADWLDACNCVWTTPSEGSAGSMPLGNGDLGVNLWVENSGDVVFYLSKTDAWDAHVRLLKLGRVRIKLDPNPFVEGAAFRQTLRLRQGRIEITGGEGPAAVTLKVWVDANRPVVRIEAEGPKPLAVQVALEPWRTEAGPLEGKQRDAARGLLGAPYPLVVPADTVVDAGSDRVAWYHRNVTSGWPITMKVQGLEELVEPSDDPLLHRTFGGAILGEGLVKQDATTLVSARPAPRQALSIYALTRVPATEAEWIEGLGQIIAADASAGIESARGEHLAWWDAFWNRSWIRVSGRQQLYVDGKAVASKSVGGTAASVSQGYALQRFINACGGRGAMPIKFNGSIFTVDAMGSDGDYRRWGSCFWWQNTRFAYWSMPACGDFDLMQPLFAMYRDALPLSRATTRAYYGHDGAFFGETIYFWGTPCNDDFGWNRGNNPQSLMINQYIRRLWQGGLELSMMMLDRYDYTGDRDFAADYLLPLADAVITFYDEHYPRETDGTLRIEPAQACETWWTAVNPMPEVAGLRAVLDRLVHLPEDLATPAQHERWTRLAGQLPPLPTRDLDGQPVLAAAQEFSNRHNSENPELYAIFPYRLYGVGRDDLEMARRTFDARAVKGSQGWQQDPVQSAMLGQADQAARFVVQRFATKDPGSRFPAFWGPNFDWTPDQCHGGNGMLGLQAMLLQPSGEKILLLPAWPKGWDVSFKLHAPQGTTIEGIYRAGQWEKLDVTPESRAADVVKVEPQ